MRASWSAPRRKCLVLLLHASLCWTSWANPGDLYDEEGGKGCVAEAGADLFYVKR
jgi:hypothetical protein